MSAYRLEVARSHNSLGRVFHDLGRRDEAEAAYRTALAIRERLTPAVFGEPTHRFDLAVSHYNSAIMVKERQKYAEALAALRVAQQVCGPLAGDFPGVPDYRQFLAMNQTEMARLQLIVQGKNAEVLAAHRTAQRLCAQLVADFPSVPDYRHDLAKSHDNLGRLLIDLGQLPEAEEVLRASVGIWERLVADSAGVVRYDYGRSWSYWCLGDVLKDKGEPQKSLGWYAKAFDILEPLLKREPRLARAKQFLVNTHWSRGDALDQLQRYDDAVRDWDRAIELSEGPDKVKFEKRRIQSLNLGGRAP